MRLIDADVYKKRIDHYPPEIRNIAKKELRYTPTIDAVPVLYCKDCKYKEKDGISEGVHYCDHNGLQVTDVWFCADGERREE